MASTPHALPLFYRELIPLNSLDHSTWRYRPTDKMTWLVRQNAVPLTVEEFSQAQRHFPIVFSMDDQPVPLALMGLNEGVNVFVDAEGMVTEDIYMPAYVRRYPFLLTKLTPDAQELSLCFSSANEIVGNFEDGLPLFTGTEPSDTTKAKLVFCERFEQAGARTSAFIDELKKHDLLIDGEATIQRDQNEAPFIYRGFQMINQNMLRELRNNVLSEWNRNGMLPLVIAHLLSLELIREIFDRQIRASVDPQAVPMSVP